MVDYEVLYRAACGYLSDLLLGDIIKIKDIPQGIRISELGRGLYGIALRVSSGASVECYVEDLTLLSEDIAIMHEDYYDKQWFQQIFVDNVWKDGCFDERGRRKLEVYRVNLSENFLLELSETNRYRWEDYKVKSEICRSEEQD